MSITAELVDTYYSYLVRNKLNYAEEKGTDHDLEDMCIPEQMSNGPGNESWSVSWKLLKSQITDIHLNEVEITIESEIPLFLRDFFTYKHIVMCEAIALPWFASDQGLTPFVTELLSWKPLLKSGYFPYVEEESGLGPICIDLHSGSENRIVYLPKDHLWSMGEHKYSVRSHVENIEVELAKSWDLFARKKIHTLGESEEKR